MDKVNFLVWYSDLAISTEDNSLVSEFLNKACKLIEQEVNQEGGFAGLKVEIAFSRVNAGAEGIEQILRQLDASPEIVLTHGHPIAVNTALLLESLDPLRSLLLLFLSFICIFLLVWCFVYFLVFV